MWLKTYDNVPDRSPLYCGSGAIFLATMAYNEFAERGEVSLRFFLMLTAVLLFVGAAFFLISRHQVRVELNESPNGEGQLKIVQRTAEKQVISEAQFAYVKLEEKQVVIHFHEGDDLRRTSFSRKGANKKKVKQLVELLRLWEK